MFIYLYNCISYSLDDLIFSPVKNFIKEHKQSNEGELSCNINEVHEGLQFKKKMKLGLD